jgi:hypothetical protein
LLPASSFLRLPRLLRKPLLPPADRARETKTQAKAGALIEEPSQKRTSQRKLERHRSWQSQWMRQKARARKSATGDPEVQWTAEAGYSSAA